MASLRSFTTLVALAALALACDSTDSTGPGNGGDNGGGGSNPPPPPPPAVRLKDEVVTSLPSPYYHFTYDSAGRVDSVSFASGFTMYQAVYSNGFLSELRNNTLGNADRVVYHYNALGQADSVSYVQPDSTVTTRVALTYSGDQLTRLERRRIHNGVFLLEKVLTFTYFADGNLRTLTDHRPEVAGFQPTSETVDSFSQYDTGTNVDAFGLLHNDFFDHLVLLPGVVLQKGNPGHVVHTGDGTEFTQDNTVTYDAEGRPTRIDGDVVLLNGMSAGQHVAVTETLTYY